MTTPETKASEGLYRLTADIAELDTVFFVGNGAVDGGDEPLTEWIREHAGASGELTFMNVVDRDHALAWLSMHLRTLRRNTPAQRDKKRPHVDAVLSLKKTLAELFHQRPPARRPLPPALEAVLFSPKTLVVCLNWDLALWETAEVRNLIQLHGTCRDCRTMIFPAEFVMDLNPPGEEHLGQQPFDVHEDDVVCLRRLHALVLETLTRCRDVFVWGLAFNAYDAEVMTLLSAGAARKPKPRLVVIDPEDAPGRRAAAMLRLTEYTHVYPQDAFAARTVRADGVQSARIYKHK